MDYKASIPENRVHSHLGHITLIQKECTSKPYLPVPVYMLIITQRTPVAFEFRDSHSLPIVHIISVGPRQHDGIRSMLCTAPNPCPCSHVNTGSSTRFPAVNREGREENKERWKMTGLFSNHAPTLTPGIAPNRPPWLDG